MDGYSIKMLRLIQAQLSQDLGQDVQLKLVTLDPNKRIPMIIEGKVDIVCDVGSFTWARDRKIDFSVNYAILVREGLPVWSQKIIRNSWTE